MIEQLDIDPFVRFARYLTLAPGQINPEVIPLDRRIFFVLEGRAKARLRDRSADLEAGDLLYIPAGVSYELSSAGSRTVFAALNFDLRRDPSAPDAPVPPSPAGAASPALIDPCRPDEPEQLLSPLLLRDSLSQSEKVCAAVSEYNCADLGSRRMCGALCCEILVYCLRRSVSGLTVGAVDLTDRVMDYVRENCRYPLTNAGVADLFGLHPNYLASLIKRRTGLPLHKYVTRVRLNKALSLLERGGVSMEEIASRCGFWDGAHFSRTFRNHFGVNPSAWAGSSGR